MSNSTAPTMPTGPDPNVPTATYNASCHCGAFAYTVTAAPPLDDASAIVTECNCSICKANGYLLIYVPNERIVFSKGRFDELSSYTFASHKMGHYFCPTCGSSCLLRSKDGSLMPGLTAVNVRMLHDVDVKTLRLKHMDGKSFQMPKEDESKT